MNWGRFSERDKRPLLFCGLLFGNELRKEKSMQNQELERYLRLHHYGKSNAVTSRELECLFHSKGVDMRDVINRLRRGGVPIASNQNGYFYAATQQEILDTIALLTRQISGITATITGLRYSLSRIDISGLLLQQKDRDAIE